MPTSAKKYSIPDQIVSVVKTLEKANFEAYLVGGCVRDLLLGKKPKDWDITTNANPEEIVSLFPKTFYENDYGTVGVVNEQEQDATLKVVEVTPYRLESEYTNKRHPDKVTFSKNLEDDLKRRDLTINAIALKIESGEKGKYKGHIVDPYKGQEAIRKGHLETVGSAEERISEDALRIMRSIRLAAELGFTISSETTEAIRKNAKLLKEISRERIRDEFNRIISSDRPEIGLIFMEKFGVLEYVIPEFIKGVGMKQNKAHAYDVWEHSLKALQHAAKKGFSHETRLAVMFHDIGKIEARKWSDEKNDWTFHGHDVMGAKTTAKIMSRMLYPKKTIDFVTKMVRWHMFFSDTDKITLSAVRRLVRNVGKEAIWDLMNLRVCDRIGTGRPKEHPYRLRKFQSMVEEVMHDAISVGMLKINGLRIMEVTHEKPGKRVGFILHALLEEALDKPDINDEKMLEERAIELSKLSEKDLELAGLKGKDKKTEVENRAIKELRDRYWVQ